MNKILAVFIFQQSFICSLFSPLHLFFIFASNLPESTKDRIKRKTLQIHQTFPNSNFHSFFPSPVFHHTHPKPPASTTPLNSTMKKLYRKGTVHPSPPLVSDHLSFLPATILTLAVALSPQDREVLAYLISCSSNSSSPSSGNRRNSSTNNNNNNNNANNSARRSTNADHPASFNCYCFRCYMSYWVRWDSSPNRQLIHEIIDAYEDGLSAQNKKEKSRKERRKNKESTGSGHGQLTNGSELRLSSPSGSTNKEFTELESSVKEIVCSQVDSTREGDDGMEDEELGKGTSVRGFVGFLGEKIWGICS